VIAVLKKEFTSFDVAAVVRELRETVLDSRVSNVYQLNAKTLIFKLHKADQPAFFVILEAGRRLHLTSYLVEKPVLPPAFCMALRKYLRNSILTNVLQYEFERVVIFHFKIKTEVVNLVLELFGEGNIILVDDEGKIQQALSYKHMRDRNILRNEPFLFAPPSGKNPMKVDKQEFCKCLKASGDVEVVRALARTFGIGGIYAEEALLKARVEKNRNCKALADAEIGAIFDGLQSLLYQVMKDSLEPHIVLDNAGNFLDVIPIKLKRYDDFKLKAYGSFNEALDEFYTGITEIEKAKADMEVDVLKSEAERLKRVVESQRKVLAEAEAKTKQEKRVGDLIYAHSNELQALLDRFQTSKQKGETWNSIASKVLIEKQAGLKPSTFFESLDSNTLTLNVLIDGFKFSLNLRKTLFENATEFYEKSKRIKQKAEGAKAALEDSQRKLLEIQAKISETEKIEHIKPSQVIEEFAKHKVRRKEWFEKFRWFTSSDGFLVLGGKDAVTNEILVKKHTEPSDIVFHSDIVGAPFVVIKTERKEPSEQVLREAAEFAASHSRGWRENFGSIDTYWVRPEQLSKTGPSGEYVPHGAFFVNGKRNWMRNVPLKIAVGAIIKENEKVIFIGGPVDAVKARTNIYTVIAPGEESGKEFLKHVLKVLAQKASKEQREIILKASIEEIREFIPYSKGRLQEKQS